MDNQPIVSIIVPVYNPPEESFARCVRSLLNQTLSSIEILLVDDGSRDAIGDACDRYASEDGRVQVLHQPNAGVGSARNRGIEAARGRYLAFVDADDEVEPCYAQHMADAIGEADLVICSLSAPCFSVEDSLSTAVEFFARPDLHSGVQYINFPVNKLFKTDLVRRFGVRFQPDVRRGEDALFFADYVPHCNSIRCISRPLYHYRDNESSAMRTFDPRLWQWERQVIERQWALFTAGGPDAEQTEFLNKWLYLKLMDAFYYYLHYDPNNKAAVNDIRRDPLFTLLMERTRRGAPRGSGPRTRLNLWLWRRCGTRGVMLGYRVMRGMRRLHR